MRTSKRPEPRLVIFNSRATAAESIAVAGGPGGEVKHVEEMQSRYPRTKTIFYNL